MSTAPLGRRERKKAALRRTIADAAITLFIERGYDEVTISEVAEAADVARTTLFAHFPTKEALAFDQDEALEQRLVDAISQREEGVSIPEALRREFHAIRADAHASPHRHAHRELIETTPALRDYAVVAWMRHEDTLAGAISAELGYPATVPLARVLARFVLDAYPLSRLGDATTMIDQTFLLIEHGWTAASATS